MRNFHYPVFSLLLAVTAPAMAQSSAEQTTSAPGKGALPTPLPNTSVFILPANRTWPIAPAATLQTPPAVSQPAPAVSPPPTAAIVPAAPTAARSAVSPQFNRTWPTSPVASPAPVTASPSIPVNPAIVPSAGQATVLPSNPGAKTVNAAAPPVAARTAISGREAPQSSSVSSVVPEIAGTGRRGADAAVPERVRLTEPSDSRLTRRQPIDLVSDYRIGSQDLLEIQVFGVEDLNRTVRVNAGGIITLPLIGGVAVANLSAQEAEALIANTLSEKYMQDPQVSVFIKEFTTQRITVEGAVTKPGIFPLTGQITLLRALALAGGGAQIADLSKVMLFRAGTDGNARAGQTYDVHKIRSGSQADPLLRNDDVVVVQRDESRRVLKDSLFRDVIDAINPFSAFSR